MTLKCEYDSGAMYGNRALCDKVAKWNVTYSNGSFSSLTIATCERHLDPTLARVYPSRTVIEPCTQPWEK